MKIAIVGATGAVGRMMIEVLEEYGLAIDTLVLFASSRSAGTVLMYKGKPLIVQELRTDSFQSEHFDIALFSAGGSISEAYAPLAAQAKTLVIDNSSTFRQDLDKALVVPEINFQAIASARNYIIANPNCSTIQSVLAIKPLLETYKVERVDYATYQAVSGAGHKGIDDLLRGEKGEPPLNFPYPIVHNVIPQIDQPLDNLYTKEEMKMVWETQKILGLEHLPVSATCVRVPVLNSHSIDIRLEFDRPVDREEVIALYEKAEGVRCIDDIKNLIYPMPIEANGHDQVLVGRIRVDVFNPKILHVFCVGDNLRKGAAANAVQIADRLIKADFIGKW